MPESTVDIVDSGTGISLSQIFGSVDMMSSRREANLKFRLTAIALKWCQSLRENGAARVSLQSMSFLYDHTTPLQLFGGWEDRGGLYESVLDT